MTSKRQRRGCCDAIRWLNGPVLELPNSACGGCSFWCRNDENVGVELQHRDNQNWSISKYSFNNTNSSTRSNHWTIRGPKTNKPPPAGTSFTSLSCRMEDKAFLIALQYLHFHARSCWRFGWRNDDCIRAARMHFWLLLGCVDAGALLPSTVISLKCWERERRDRITIPRGSIITLGGFILSLNAPPPSRFVSDAPVKIYIVPDNKTHFSFLLHGLILWNLTWEEMPNFCWQLSHMCCESFINIPISQRAVKMCSEGLNCNYLCCDIARRQYRFWSTEKVASVAALRRHTVRVRCWKKAPHFVFP